MVISPRVFTVATADFSSSAFSQLVLCSLRRNERFRPVSQIYTMYIWYCIVYNVYIGETGRNLSLRLKEHKTNCEKAKLEKSAVAKHTWTNDHRIKWNEASILATESHKFSRKMRESIEIEKHSTIDQEGKPLDSTWRAPLTMQN